VIALRRTTGAALVLTYVLIVLGAWVRATASGLACPDWPTCYGQWLPLPGEIPVDAGYTYFQVMLEWVHRLIAGVILGPLFLVLAWLCWRVREHNGRFPLYAAALLLLQLIQAGLGGLTVLDQNSPWSVALHLSTALVLFSVLCLIFERSRDAVDVYPPAAVPALAVMVWLTALATMASAAMTAKSGAALACGSWPLCNQGLIPDLADPLVRLNVTHRALAAITALGAIALHAVSRRYRPLHGPPLAASVLVLVGIAFGAVVVLSGAPLWAALLHQALGVAAFAAISLAMWRCLGHPAPRVEPLYVRVSRARSAL